LGSGELEFLGRLDDQVQIRGFRVELGEIEAALSEHPAVLAAVVRLRVDAAGNERLVAWLVPGAEVPGAEAPRAEAPRAAELRDFLKLQLPEYMVPAAFVVLATLPMTATGKVDLRALPAPDGERPEQEQAYIAPRDELEEQLAAIWGELLGVDRVGINDSFFDLGGHSLLSTQVVSRVREELGVALPLGLLFEAPTLAGLAAAYWRQEMQGDESDLAAMMAEMEELSDEELERLLAAENESQER
jgi:acyl carrier protein